MRSSISPLLQPEAQRLDQNAICWVFPSGEIMVRPAPETIFPPKAAKPITPVSTHSQRQGDGVRSEL